MSATRVRETILVVHEAREMCHDLCRILLREGYRAIPASHGLDTQWCVERHGSRIDLLIAPLAAPEADAYHLGIPIGSLFPRTPALFYSRGTREQHVRAGLLRPGTPFLRLPFPPSALTRAVRAILDRPARRHLM